MVKLWWMSGPEPRPEEPGEPVVPHEEPEREQPAEEEPREEQALSL